jgi:hypothetical protein
VQLVLLRDVKRGKTINADEYVCDWDAEMATLLEEEGALV